MDNVIAGRPIEGITINGLEWLLTDEDEVMIFDSEELAVQFLKDHGVTDEALAAVVFVHSIGTCRRCGSPLFPSQIEGYTSQCFTCDEDFYGIEQETVAADAILVELDYKGSYSRFALTEEEFKKEYPETFESFGPIEQADTDTIKPMVHIWFCPCKVGDEKWKRHFTDMEYGLPESDIESENLAYVDPEKMGELKKYLKLENSL